MDKTNEEQMSAFMREAESMKKIASDMMPQMLKFGDQFKSVLESQKAKESKNIKFTGTDCVALLFEDRVTIQMVNFKQAEKLYGLVGEYDENLKASLDIIDNQEKELYDVKKQLAVALVPKKIKIFDWWKQLFKRNG